MPTIALIHSGRSFMPEIGAYQEYFQGIGIEATPLLQPSQHEMEPFDILWFFMGIQETLNSVNKKKFIVHEFCSASTPPFAGLKDLIKKIINPAPGLRITLSPEHRGIVFPEDDIPLISRDQGVHKSFYERRDCEKEYDFIYTGSASATRRTGKWLRTFSIKFPAARILLVGNHEPGLTRQFSTNPNIEFRNPLPVSSLPALLASSRFAVNYLPDIYPFNMQPSTKLLEYCAAGCNIISNRYAWVNHFSGKMKAGIFFIDDQFDNLSLKNLEQFRFTHPDMFDYRWESIFEKMQLQRYLMI